MRRWTDEEQASLDAWAGPIEGWAAAHRRSPSACRERLTGDAARKRRLFAPGSRWAAMLGTVIDRDVVNALKEAGEVVTVSDVFHARSRRHIPAFAERGAPVRRKAHQWWGTALWDEPRELRGWPRHSQCTPGPEQQGSGWTKGPPPRSINRNAARTPREQPPRVYGETKRRG